MKRGTPLKRSPLKKKGPKSNLWDVFRAKKVARDRDEEGLIKCQDWKIGLPRCGVVIPSPDLHHIEGRDKAPGLYFDEENLVWLIRGCHDDAHNKR